MITLSSINRTKGTVLVTVMLMVAVAALIASDIAYRQQMDVLRTGAFMARDASTFYLWGAEEGGVQALKADRDEDDRRLKSGKYIILQDDWSDFWYEGKIFPLPNGAGFIEGKLYDLQGRFNINSLVAKDRTLRPRYAQAFVNILGPLLTNFPNAFEQGVTASDLKDRVIDWLDEDEMPTGAEGMEDDAYFRKDRPYRTANHVMVDISELLLIDGFTPQAIRLLEDKLAFLPSDTQINLYTADTQFLIDLGFDSNQVGEFDRLQRPHTAEDRNNQYVVYDSVEALINFLKAAPAVTGSTPPVGPNDLTAAMFDFKSQFFLLKGKAVVNGKPVLIESVIWRPLLNAAAGNQGPPIKTIMRKFVDPLKQTN